MNVSVLGIKQYKRIENSKKEGDLFAVCDVLINSWLEIKNVRILRGNDDKLFVSFPQLKSEDPKGSGKFRDVLTFKDKNIRKELEAAVLAAYQDRLLNGLYAEEDFKITILLNKEKEVRLKAWAAIELEGIVVSGIMIWEGKTGMTVSMPQRLMHNPVNDKDEWVDLIYPTNCYQKKLLMDKIIEAYHKERVQHKEKVGPASEKLSDIKDGFASVVDPDNPFYEQRGEKNDEPIR